MHYGPIVDIFRAHAIDAAAYLWAHKVLMHVEDDREHTTSNHTATHSDHTAIA